MNIRSTIFFVLPLVILLFVTTGTFGQGTPKWGPWEKVDCYSGISASIVNMGPSKAAGGYLWGIRFRNDYDVPVQFSYKMAIGEDPTGEFGFDVTTKLKPGEIWTDGSDKTTAKLYKSPSNSYAVKIKGVCFKDAYCGKECYAECDVVPKKPNQPSCNNKSPEKAKVVSDENESISNENDEWKGEKGEIVIIDIGDDGLIYSTFSPITGDLISQDAFTKISATEYRQRKSVMASSLGKGGTIRFEAKNKFTLSIGGVIKRFNRANPSQSNGSSEIITGKINAPDENGSTNERKTDTADENKSPNILGNWQLEGEGYSKVWSDPIKVEDRFINNVHYLGMVWNEEVTEDEYNYEKVSNDEYQVKDYYGPFCIIKIINNNRFSQSCKLWNWNVVYYNRLP